MQVWDDQQIEVGAKWREEIEQALASATVAVLLVSPAFLASNFIHNEEIPKLLKAAEERGLVVFWIPVRASSYKETQIVDYQSAHPPTQPIARMRPEDRDDAWVKICEKLGKVLRRQQATQVPENKTPLLPPIPVPPPVSIPTTEPLPETPITEATVEILPASTEDAAVQPIPVVEETASIETTEPTELTEPIPSDLPPSEPIPAPPPSDPTISRQQLLQGLGVFGIAIVVAGVEQITQKFTSSAASKGKSVEEISLEKFNFKTVTVDWKGDVIRISDKQAEFFKEDLGYGVVLEMVKIPGASFKMGSPETEKDRSSSESPQHTVNMPSFFMGKFAVTQAQYQRIMGSNPANFKGEERPVEQISWDDAVEFCFKLSKRTGRTYRLPSEAEWEYACRAGTTTPFHFGETITSTLANYDASVVYRSEPKGEYRQQTTDVGTFPPNAFGLYDMHGNVWEWCQDHWHDSYQGAPNDGSAWLSENKDANPMLRGGSWVDVPRHCRSATRLGCVADGRIDFFGFRVSCSAARTL